MRARTIIAGGGALVLVAVLLGWLFEVGAVADPRHPSRGAVDPRPVVVERLGSARGLRVTEVGDAAHLAAGARALDATVVGRVVRPQSDPGAPAGPWPAGAGVLHQWPGVYATARFGGDAVIVAFDDPLNRYRIALDEGAGPVVTVARPGAGALRLSGLGPGPHVVRIDRISESLSGAARFVGFFVPAEGEALPPPPARRRRIEFIGDSDSVGYGNAAPGRACAEGDVFWLTDTQASFGPRAARRLDADYHLVAASGAGLVRNHDGADSERTMVALEPRALLDDPAPFPSGAWRPQVVVIALGSNDFSSAPRADERWADAAALRADFEVAYARLVRRLRADNPNAYVLLVAWEEYGPDYLAAHEAVLAALRASGGTRVDLLILPAMDRSGCHWHPSSADHEAAADAIVRHLEARPDAWGG